jgi:hypothetical protein
MKKCFMSTCHPSYIHAAVGECWFTLAHMRCAFTRSVWKTLLGDFCKLVYFWTLEFEPPKSFIVYKWALYSNLEIVLYFKSLNNLAKLKTLCERVAQFMHRFEAIQKKSHSKHIHCSHCKNMCMIWELWEV